MLLAIVSVLLSSATPAIMPAVDVGRFDPANFPQIEMRDRIIPRHVMLSRVERILRERQCRLEGQNYRRFDIRVPYVVMMEPNGTPTRFVVADIGCRPLETFVGQVIVEFGRAGYFRPPGGSQAQWYASELRFIVSNSL